MKIKSSTEILNKMEMQEQNQAYLAPGYPSEYLLVKQEPRASITARLAKFCKNTFKTKKTQFFHLWTNILSEILSFSFLHSTGHPYKHYVHKNLVC